MGFKPFCSGNYKQVRIIMVKLITKAILILGATGPQLLNQLKTKASVQTADVDVTRAT
jgi:hypothetical protein